MNLEQLDQKLATLKGELTQITSNVMELQQLPIYKAAKTWTMTGKTKEKVEPAFGALERIWEFLPLIRDVLNKADAARAEMPRFMQGAKIAEIEALVTGQSISMPRVAVPLEQRGLLSAAEQKPTQSIDQLKAAMVEAYDKAKEVLFDLREVRRTIDEQFNKLQRQCDELKEKAESYGKGTPAEISDLMARLTRQSKKRETDPLGMSNIRTEIEPYITIAQQKVTALGRERDQIGVDLKQAQVKLQTLKANRVKALECHQQAQSEIENPEGLLVPPSTKDLSAWLDDLAKVLAEQRWESCRLGLLDWMRKHDELYAEVEASLLANRKPVEKRRAILNRWAEAKRKTEEFKPKGLVVDKALTTFAEKAEEFTVGKMDLAKADTVIFSYETRLAEMISRLPQ